MSVQRAVTLLNAAGPDRSGGDWMRVSIGERDAGLLSLREELFGPRLEATAACPGCAEQLDLTFSTVDVRVAPIALAGAGDEFSVDEAGYTVSCRLATSADLLEIAATAPADRRDTLLKRCVVAGRFAGAPVDPSTLPDEVLAAAVGQMARVDAQADVQIALVCPVCTNQWSMTFDILTYLWSEVDDWARRLLIEVHTLASAYGWSERDIVEMSARRRRTYLELVGV
jgi:hypothetical protein